MQNTVLSRCSSLTRQVVCFALFISGGLALSSCLNQGARHCTTDGDCFADEVCSEDNACVPEETVDGPVGDAESGDPADSGRSDDGGSLDDEDGQSGEDNPGDDAETDRDGGGGDDAGDGETKYCLTSCEEPMDCSEHNPEWWACREGVCEPDMCDSSEGCAPALSNWRSKGCTGSCSEGYTCIDYRDETWCAAETTEAEGCEKEDWRLESVDVVQPETSDAGTGNAYVCVIERKCVKGICALDTDACETDDECPSGRYCDDGECKCQSDEGCQNGGSCDAESGECTCTDGMCDEGNVCATH